jgi:hypothetical protein
VVFALFVTLPHGKFVHGLYRHVALVRYARERQMMRHTWSRHCEPTGRANARPMTGSAKQSMPTKQEWIASSLALLAMTRVGGIYKSTTTYSLSTNTLTVSATYGPFITLAPGSTLTG